MSWRLEPFSMVSIVTLGGWFTYSVASPLCAFLLWKLNSVVVPIVLRQFQHRTSNAIIGNDLRSALNDDRGSITISTKRCSHHRCPSRIATDPSIGYFRISAAVDSFTNSEIALWHASANGIHPWFPNLARFCAAVLAPRCRSEPLGTRACS